MERTLNQLTTREQQVAECLAYGYSRKEVPDVLQEKFGIKLSVDTVRTVQQHIYEKWNIGKLSELCVVFLSIKHTFTLHNTLGERLIAFAFLVIITPSVIGIDDCDNYCRRSGRVNRSYRARTRSGRRNDTYYIPYLFN